MLDGANFKTVAQEHSDCPSKTSGGDLGTFSRGSMVPPFEKAAFNQTVDEIGPVIETRFGYHIVQVLAHNRSGTTPLDSMKDRIIEHLTQEKRRATIEDYIDRLRADATVTYGSRS